jgi:hypothetical protein
VSRACIADSVRLILQGDERLSICVEPVIAPESVRENEIVFDFSLRSLFPPLIDPHSTVVLRDTLTEHVRVDVELALFAATTTPMRFTRRPRALLLDGRVPLMCFPDDLGLDDLPTAGTAICRFGRGGHWPDPTRFIDRNRTILTIVPKTSVAAQLFEFVPLACLHVRCFVLVPRVRGRQRRKDESLASPTRRGLHVQNRETPAKTPSPSRRGSGVMKGAMAQKTPVPYRNADQSPLVPYLAPDVRKSPRKDEAPRKPSSARQTTRSQV